MVSREKRRQRNPVASIPLENGSIIKHCRKALGKFASTDESVYYIRTTPDEIAKIDVHFRRKWYSKLMVTVDPGRVWDERRICLRIREDYQIQTIVGVIYGPNRRRNLCVGEAAIQP